MEKLNEWLRNLKNVPEKKARVKTFMDIAGINHRENSWSDIYAYYLDSSENHGMGRLFIDSLLEIIVEKTGSDWLEMNEFVIQREVVTKDNKRIDLVITDGAHAIIIENKVYAWLYNELTLYWDELKNIPESNKRGIVLSLHPVDTSKNDNRFINITHIEFASQIEKNIYKYLTCAQSKPLLFLQDFLQNIYNITNNMNKEEVKFYYSANNRPMINRLADIRKNVIEYLSCSIEDAEQVNPILKSKGMNLSVVKKQHCNYVYYVYDGYKDNAMITLVYHRLWDYNANGCRIQAILEFQGKVLKWVDKHQSEIESELGYSVNSRNIKNGSFWHFKIEDLYFNPEDDLAESFQIKLIEKLEASGLYDDGIKILKLFKTGQV